MGSLDGWLLLALCVAALAYMCHWIYQTYGAFFHVTSRPRAVRRTFDSHGHKLDAHKVGGVMERDEAFGDMRRRPWAPERSK